MRYSKLFGKTIKDTPKDAALASHKLLYQAGYIRESTAGRYYLLPLGLRVQQKMQRIVKEEMDRAGAQEIVTPTLHPKSLWQETNRTTSVGFELMSIKDRNQMEFVLGGTAEEMLVDVVRKFQISYKDLPFNLYQFSTKFRDEMRARGGLLRLREFVMKDAYSFHATEEDFKKEYESMRDTYTRIFKRFGLETMVVAADNGYIGGEYCHEFQVKSDAGEDTLFYVPSKNLTFNKEIAPAQAPAFDQKGEKPLPMEEVEGVGIIGVEELAKYLKIPVEITTKTILFETDKGEVVAAAVRGEYAIDETKLKRVVGCLSLSLLSAEKVKEVTGAEVGYAGLLNLPKSVKIVMDDSMKGRVNFEMGANRTNYHTINVNFGRDLEEPKEFYDIKETRKGDLYPETGEPYEVFRGVEVGNIFQLGYHYSTRMKDALFTAEDGERKPFYMGCYGIGLARTLATIVEESHDDKGIVWPIDIAPYTVHLISVREDEKAEQIYNELQKAGIEVLYDDREGVSVGAKFADADLIGLPIRIVVSGKALAEGKDGEVTVEWKERNKLDAEIVPMSKVLRRLSKVDLLEAAK